MLERVSRKIQYFASLLKTGSLGVLLYQLRRQLYSRDNFLCLEKNLIDDVPAQCRLQYKLNLASVEDIEEVLKRAKIEGNSSAHDLIQRYWFYQCGFHNCYVARLNGSGEICHLAWLIFPDEESVIEQNLKGRLPALAKDDCLLENVYTFVKYRGKGLMSSVIVNLSGIAGSRGYTRMITYVREDNSASLKACEAAGFKKYEDAHQMKLLFFTFMKHNNRKIRGNIN